MSESDTPETNGEVNEHLGASTFGMVTADFARRLERERNEAKAQRDELLNAFGKVFSNPIRHLSMCESCRAIYVNGCGSTSCCGSTQGIIWENTEQKENDGK